MIIIITAIAVVVVLAIIIPVTISLVGGNDNDKKKVSEIKVSESNFQQRKTPQSNTNSSKRPIVTTSFTPLTTYSTQSSSVSATTKNITIDYKLK